MQNNHKLALKISSSLLIFFFLLLLLSFFIYSWSNSIRDFYDYLLQEKINYGNDEWFNILIWASLLGLFIGSYIICYLFSKNIFCDIDRYNKKLKDYNHFLAHELKTPISAIYSHLDILSYGFDEKRITSSQEQLKNMIKVIDGLLNFSESIKLGYKSEINLENFLKRNTSFLDQTKQITIHNKLFNFSLHTDEVLFSRVIKNLIDNAVKYSSDQKLQIHMQEEKLIFSNNIPETLSDKQIEKSIEKFYSKSFEDKKWHGIWIPMLQEITKVLGYEMKIYSQDSKFIVEIYYDYTPLT